jgi:hypothetical protein
MTCKRSVNSFTNSSPIYSHTYMWQCVYLVKINSYGPIILVLCGLSLPYRFTVLRYTVKKDFTVLIRQEWCWDQQIWLRFLCISHSYHIYSLLWTWQWDFRFHKMSRISWVDEQLFSFSRRPHHHGIGSFFLTQHSSSLSLNTYIMFNTT